MEENPLQETLSFPNRFSGWEELSTTLSLGCELLPLPVPGVGFALEEVNSACLPLGVCLFSSTQGVVGVCGAGNSTILCLSLSCSLFLYFDLLSISLPPHSFSTPLSFIVLDINFKLFDVPLEFYKRLLTW